MTYYITEESKQKLASIREMMKIVISHIDADCRRFEDVPSLTNPLSRAKDCIVEARKKLDTADFTEAIALTKQAKELFALCARNAEAEGY